MVKEIRPRGQSWCFLRKTDSSPKAEEHIGFRMDILQPSRLSAAGKLARDFIPADDIRRRLAVVACCLLQQGNTLNTLPSSSHTKN